MADGVDHIDIYADVGEEFNQVQEAPRRLVSAMAAALRVRRRWGLWGRGADFCAYLRGRLGLARRTETPPPLLTVAPPQAARAFSRLPLRVIAESTPAARKRPGLT